jgi:hypothetical protein
MAPCISLRTRAHAVADSRSNAPVMPEFGDHSCRELTNTNALRLASCILRNRSPTSSPRETAGWRIQIVTRRGSYGDVSSQRPSTPARHPARYASVVGCARHCRPDGNEIRLRYRTVWCLHGASRWPGDPFLYHSCGLCSREEDDNRRCDRRNANWQKGSASLARSRGGSVWLLPIGPNHVCGRSIGKQFQSQRCRHRRGHVRQYLPVRHLSTHPGCDQVGGADLLTFGRASTT